MNNYDYYYLAKRNILPDADSRTRLVGEIKKGSRVHISAVCGKAMASIACMLVEYGCVVSGSDNHFHPPMSDVLDSHGIIKLKPSIDNLKKIDLVVVGNTLSHNSLEVEEARRKNIPMISGSEAVAQIFNGKRSLVVAGTHGKTTTSAMLTHVFVESGMDPAYMIGGVFQNSKDSYSMGSKKSKYVIYEGDEYNCAFFDRAPKFLRYNPTSSIITSIEHDHFDLYNSFSDYKQAFQFLLDISPKEGFMIVHESTIKYLDLSKCRSKIFTYGKSNSSDLHYKINKINSEGTFFSIQSKKFGLVKNIFIPMFGEYNIANATSVYALARLEGVTDKKIRIAFGNFPGTKERQELIGTKSNDIVVIRDYAHHPTAVSVTLEGLKSRYPNRRLLAVFEPRSSSSRRKIFEDDYSKSLLFADVSFVVSPPFISGKDNINDFMDVNNIQKKIELSNKKCFSPKNCSEALKLLLKTVKKGDVVVFMSSGDFESIPEKFLRV